MPAQPSANVPATTLNALLPRWANDHDGWCRAIAADILRNPAQASDTDIDRYLRLLLCEKQLSADAFSPVPPLEQTQVDANPLEAVQLRNLKIGAGINALRSGAELTFAPGVTVVFGENGSGKSGFVRVLKRAAGVRTAEDILHDVRGDARPTPRADFAVRIGAVDESIRWQNDFGVAPLNRISVFDARGARIHVEDDLTYVYTPGELTLFPLVQNAVERIRTALESAIATRRPGTNSLLGYFDRSCSIYPVIETLGAATDLNQIRTYATVPDGIEGTIDSLSIEIDALQSTNTQNELNHARGRLALVRAVSEALAAAKSFDIATYRSLLADRDLAARRHDEAGDAAFRNSDIPGSLSTEWRRFIQAGEEYLKTHATPGYPEADSSCAYCRQPLTASALQLLQKYREFCNSAIRTALDDADTRLRRNVGPVLAVNASALRQQLDTHVINTHDVLAPVRTVLRDIEQLTTDLAANSAVTWSDKDQSVSVTQTIVSAEERRLDDLIASLQTSIDERQAALRNKQAELSELKGRRTVRTLLPKIEQRVEDAKWVGRATIVRENMTGVLRSLTKAAKEASEKLLNRDFEERFARECERLRAPTVTLNFPGRQGQTIRRKLVASYKPSQILSEGEQKALALADFLAEVTSVPASSPVVFDDPISSMDYRRIHEVCDRIVALSDDHQVIVFTHNIWFAAELLSKAKRTDWKYYDIAREDDEVGVVAEASHPRVDTFKQVRGRLNGLIAAADGSEGEVKAALVEKGYEYLRNLSEIVVEHELLKGVVQRYEPNVMMTKLGQINIDKLQDSMVAIVPIYDKSCRYIGSHSQPVETQGIRPTLGELKADFQTLLDAREGHKG